MALSCESCGARARRMPDGVVLCRACRAGNGAEAVQERAEPPKGGEADSSYPPCPLCGVRVLVAGDPHYIEGEALPKGMLVYCEGKDAA